MVNMEYRGICKDKRKMVYGQYIQTMDDHIICSCDDIVPYGCEHWYGIECGSYVYPETVGKYTGIKDYNGVKIYTGDIVEIEFMDHIVKGDKFKGIVKFYDGSFFVENEKLQNAHFLFREVDILTVLGNAYENVELLEDVICY